MTSLFARNAEIAAGPLPLSTVGQDTPAAGAILGEKMGQLVPKRSFNFFRAKLPQSWVQRHKHEPEIGTTDCCSHSTIPNHPHGPSAAIMRTHGAQEFSRALL